jgi:hypothetical protein
MINLWNRRHRVRLTAGKIAAACLSLGLLPSLARAQNLISTGNFDQYIDTANPWAGVDLSGDIHGLNGAQKAVNDSGSIYNATFGPSVAVGDLNGDGKPDLVLADSRGFFWYYPNTGTPQKPAFTQGNVLPIWLGEKRIRYNTEGSDNVVPRIQLVDLHGSGKLDIVAGNYAGKLFYIPNIGTPQQPKFAVTQNIDALTINTHSAGTLWCDYLAPFLYNWTGRGVLDLVMGEGTYSANSIYLLSNQASTLDPLFNETNRQKIIPGMGLEQLTPTVVDWNNDGKPDILTGDRTGGLTLYLNTSTDPAHPTFAAGRPVTIGGQTKFGAFTTVTVADLTGNKLPNLIIGNDQGNLLYATNQGRLGEPSFPSPAVPLKGVNPCPKILQSAQWTEIQPPGVPYELVVCTNPQLEPGLTFPAQLKAKYALKFFRYPIDNPIAPEGYYPPAEDEPNMHIIRSNASVSLLMKTRYRLHIWVKADQDISNVAFQVYNRHVVGNRVETVTAVVPLQASSDWSETTTTFTVEKNFSEGKEVAGDLADLVGSGPFNFVCHIKFVGQGTLYLADLSVEKAP